MIKETAVILIGGKSSRMDYNDKYLLKLGNQRFIDNILNQLLGFKEIVISANEKQDVDLSYRIVIDEIKDIGPIGALYSLFKQINSETLFVVSCDTPFITDKMIDKLYKNFDKEHDAIIATANGRKHPLFAIYNKSIYKNILKQIENNNYRLMSLLNESKVKYIEFDKEADKLENINTIEQYNEKIKANEY